MIEKIAIDIVGQMEREKLIREDTKERYIYVLIFSMERFITIATIVVISMAVQMFLPTMFFLLFFLALRKRTGGYHLDKFYQCYVCTIVSYIFVLAIGEKVIKFPVQLYVILALAIGVIGIIGTVNHPNMHMNSEELKESRSAARLTVLLEGSVILCCVLLRANMIFISYMAIAVIMCAALLCIAKLSKQEVKE